MAGHAPIIAQIRRMSSGKWESSPWNARLPTIDPLSTHCSVMTSHDYLIRLPLCRFSPPYESTGRRVQFECSYGIESGSDSSL